ncbi:MAG: hypothetical protein KAH16_02750 [Candidatus Izimaplasma sp.]|nr:hypothetical protein [Candidatus Izimaplasma bacterium]
MLRISDKTFIILILSISIIAIILAPINAYRLSNEFHRMPVEQLGIYRSFLVDNLILLTILMVALIIRFRNKDGIKEYVLLRTYSMVMLSLISSLYLMGITIGPEFTYQYFIPWWMFLLLSIITIVLSIILVSKSYLLGEYQVFTNVFSIIITLFYGYLFISILIDSATMLELI